MRPLSLKLFRLQTPSKKPLVQSQNAACKLVRQQPRLRPSAHSEHIYHDRPSANCRSSGNFFTIDAFHNVFFQQIITTSFRRRIDDDEVKYIIHDSTAQVEVLPQAHLIDWGFIESAAVTRREAGTEESGENQSRNPCHLWISEVGTPRA